MEDNIFEIDPNAPVESLIKRTEFWLKSENWKTADAYCVVLLDSAPENPFGYLYKLMAAWKIPTRERLADFGIYLGENEYYQNAIHYAHNSLADELKGYIKDDDDYEEAKAPLTVGKVILRIGIALGCFAAVVGIIAAVCLFATPKIELYANYEAALGYIESGDYDSAHQLLAELGDYEDSKEYLARFTSVPKYSEESYTKYGIEEGYEAIERIYDENGRIVKEIMTVIEDGEGSSPIRTYEYDERGNLIKEEMTTDDVVDYSYVYEYDENDLMIKSTELHTTGKTEIAVYTYDEKGNNIRKEITLDSGSVNILDNKFDERGNKIETVKSYSTLGTVITEKYTYDDQNRVTEFTSTRSNSQLQTTETYEYDEYGNCILKTESTGYITAYTYEYDEYGNILAQYSSRAMEDKEPVSTSSITYLEYHYYYN